METKYDAYKRYDWAGDARWQLFMSNLTPVPAIQILEKKRRRWYKLNVDKDFDVDYNPETQQPQPEQQPRQRPMNAGQAFFERQAASDPIFRFVNMPDAMPELKGI
jgi:hypothetical protein